MKCKLLVAEDELIERKVLCKTLQKYLGDLILLYEAKNGREAAELFAREAPQVVILDIEMPGMTGLEVARKIRETDKNCAILFLTGFDKFDYAKQAISVHAQDYLLKPYKEQEAALRYSDAYFCKLFKQCFKVNFSTYLNEFRVRKAQQLMADARMSLKDISTACGYSDANYFARVFKRITGQTPSDYRLAAAEQVVRNSETTK